MIVIHYPSGQFACELDENMNTVDCVVPKLAALLESFRTKGMRTMVLGADYDPEHNWSDGVTRVKLTPNTVGLLIEKLEELGFIVSD